MRSAFQTVGALAFVSVLLGCQGSRGKTGKEAGRIGENLPELDGMVDAPLPTSGVIHPRVPEAELAPSGTSAPRSTKPSDPLGGIGLYPER